MDLIEIGKIVGLCFFAYLFGSIPFGYIICRAKKVDIQKVGSGGTGGTNVRRALGLKYAIWVSTLDAWKGAMPIIVARYFLSVPWWAIGLTFLCYMMGAIFSIWLKWKVGSFKAGKGVAALIGGLLVLAGWQVWLIIMGIWLVILIFFVRRKMSAASLILTGLILISILAIPIFLYMLPMLLAVVVLIWWAHRENLQRILSGKEPPIKLPAFFDKIPDDIVGWRNWSIEKLQLLIKKLQKLKKEEP
ncbi:Glycerol-3-phosphate acyltransferase [subsurface metagenome]